ncbi:MAG: T9SS type A sorting domain-containing protein [Bacteroidia bacterium]|nr:T9SS type A sorting domain-containing protein [Bacteroidia bacterium]
MKKLLIIFLLIISSIDIFGQIQLVHSSQIFNIGHVGVLHLYYAGNKFVERNDSMDIITLYNSDFSVYKIIGFPPLPYNSDYHRWVHYITENLFDTDSTDLEYLLYYQDTSQNFHVRIYDEAGTLLFQRDSASSYPHFGNSPIGIHPYSSDIDYVDSTFYLRVYTDFATEIYQLPGVIPCFDPCSNSNLGLLTSLGNNLNLPAYFLSDPMPNPATNEAEIKFTLPPNVQTGYINIYDQQGKQIRRILVDAKTGIVNIPLNDLYAGIYYYNLTWDGNASLSNKKLLVIR